MTNEELFKEREAMDALGASISRVVVAVLTTALIVSNCDATITIHHLELAQATCEPHKGLRSMDATLWGPDTLYCKDGSRFPVSIWLVAPAPTATMGMRG